MYGHTIQLHFPLHMFIITSCLSCTPSHSAGNGSDKVPAWFLYDLPKPDRPQDLQLGEFIFSSERPLRFHWLEWQLTLTAVREDAMVREAKGIPLAEWYPKQCSPKLLNSWAHKLRRLIFPWPKEPALEDVLGPQDQPNLLARLADEQDHANLTPLLQRLCTHRIELLMGEQQAFTEAKDEHLAANMVLSPHQRALSWPLCRLMYCCWL